MPEYKLTYFNIRAIAEPIRYILSYMGKEFEDVRIPLEQWPALKNSTPFGKVPTLEINGKIFHQSDAICRFLANEAGLSGKTPEENLLIDQIVGAIGDLKGEISKVVRAPDPETKEKNRQNVINEILPFCFGRFEQALQENGGYLANGKLSWADLYLIGYSESLPGILQINLVEQYPHYRALQDKVQALPGIKEWISRRPASLF
uniref:glutathione transferase n=1 Tax=Riptortus pedestris TaxID=329032 RepID=R4WD93_RIPPE|nr:glutathionetransferase [Riptortus pedestris]